MKNDSNKKSIQEINHIISEIWDKNVMIRALDLENLTDLSYTKTIEPWVLSQILEHTSEESSILDVGSGCGFMTNAVYQSGRHNIKGIDLSYTSVKYSKERYPQIAFNYQDIYLIPRNEKYDLCMAIMVANNVPDMKRFFSIIHDILYTNGKLVMVIPHPCFWPEKRIGPLHFCYSREDRYSISFSTKGRKDYTSNIFYFHRPLEAYIQCITELGFQIDSCHGLYESTQQQKPDTLGMVLVKNY